MTGAAGTVRTNLFWELRRLRRSQRIYLLLIPPVAGPVGSAIADLYLKVPSVATAQILGLLVTAGLAGLILLDLTALAVGEDLVRRAHLATFALPQDPRWAMAGRLLVATGAPIGAYLIGAAAVWQLGGALLAPTPLPTVPLFDPGHLFWAIPGLLLALAGVTAAGAVVTRSSSEAIVAGVLAGVVVAGGVGYLVAQHQVTALDPVLLGLAGVGALAASALKYPAAAE